MKKKENFHLCEFFHVVEQINKNKCSNIGWLFLQYEMLSDFDYNM